MPFFNDIYQDRRVFVTGHTGFKGSWLLAILAKLGAKCRGFSLTEPVSDPNHFSLLNLSCEDIRGDARDYPGLRKAIDDFRPEIVFHLAAQPLVRYSYDHPLETIATNVLGTANLLDACRHCPSVRGIVVVTTDKVYENTESDSGYQEEDRLGGHDPYAASKACAELVVGSYRNSFLGSQNQRLASARAGNVIGGGDWAADRLIPDLVKSAVQGEITSIRMPDAVRPWEHVLEPLFGYLLLGEHLFRGEEKYAEAWNFGPDEESCVPVGVLAEKAASFWNRIRTNCAAPPRAAFHETGRLYLQCGKARTRLGLSPIWDFEETVRATIEWYRDYYENREVSTLAQLERYLARAREKNAVWTS